MLLDKVDFLFFLLIIKCNMQGELVNGKESNGLKDAVSREQNIPEVCLFY